MHSDSRESKPMHAVDGASSTGCATAVDLSGWCSSGALSNYANAANTHVQTGAINCWPLLTSSLAFGEPLNALTQALPTVSRLLNCNKRCSSRQVKKLLVMEVLWEPWWPQCQADMEDDPEEWDLLLTLFLTAPQPTTDWPLLWLSWDSLELHVPSTAAWCAEPFSWVWCAVVLSNRVEKRWIWLPSERWWKRKCQLMPKWKTCEHK